jgi:hypothetical protein
MAFARHQFELSKPQEDGTPLLIHLQRVWENTGSPPAMLRDAPALPAGCKQLWEDFLELHGSRGSTGWGAARITFADLHAWQQVNGVRLSPWEIGCIRKADDLWLAEFQPKPKEPKQ